MKKYVIVSVAILTAILIIAATKVTPQYHSWKRIFDNSWIGANGDGTDTTAAFSTSEWNGTVVIHFETDTTAGGPSDSCLTVFYQIKRKYINPSNGAVDEDWSGWYGDPTSVTRTKIDTVARSYSNRNGTFWMAPAEISTIAWAPGDSMRFILKIGTGDSLRATIDVAGQ